MRLAGRNAVVTGAASGIGRETALRFAEEGAAVVCADLDAKGAAAVAASVVANGAVAAAASVDITSEREVARLAEEALAALGRVDVLVNNAGVTILGGVAELTEADWQREIDINLSGAYRVSKAFWPHMAGAGGGAILSTASIAGVVGVRQDAAYVASKAGLIMLTRCMALDGAPHGIRANCICPGFVDTPMFQDYLAEQPDPKASLDRAAGCTPLGHIGTPRDIADGFVYLASDDARWITGTALVIDGGLTAGLTE